MASQAGDRNSTLRIFHGDQKSRATELKTHGYTIPQNKTSSADSTMQMSFPNHGQPTSSRGDSKYVQPFPKDAERKATTPRSPICQLECERANQDTSTNASVCGSLHYSSRHFRNNQQLSLVPSADYHKWFDHTPTLRPSVGSVNLREKQESDAECPASFGLVLPDGETPRRSKTGASSIWDITCETWFGVTVVLCLMAVGFVHLRMRIRVLEEQNMEQFKTLADKLEEKNIELEHIKSRMNILEQLVNGMNGADIKHGMENTLETTTDSTRSMKLLEEPQRLPVFTGATSQPVSRGGGLSRAKRDADQQKNGPIKGVMKSVIEDYCNAKSAKGTCKQTNRQLDFVQFHAVFDGSALMQHRSTMKPDFTGDPNRVNINGEWPVIMGEGNVIKYINQGSPLNIYQTYKHQTVDNSTILVENSKFASSFTVKTTGLYAVHLNITILDEDEIPGKEHYIGVHLNDQAVLACLSGGFRCPDNLSDSSKVRICNINGILNLKDSDRIQVKTMEANTTIRIETKRNSLLTMVLLHKN